MKAIELAAILNENMPSIGFCSWQKRVNAYARITGFMESYNEDFETQIEALAILTHMNKDFCKATLAVALKLRDFRIGTFFEGGYNCAVIYAQKHGLPT